MREKGLIYIIYKIVGTDDRILYVGRTVKPRKRELEHQRKYPGCKLVELEKVDEEIACLREVYWIRNLNPPNNKMTSGSGPKPGYKTTEDKRRKISESHLSRRDQTAENTRKMHESMNPVMKSKIQADGKASALKQWSERTPEERSRIGQKIWETRRENARKRALANDEEKPV